MAFFGDGLAFGPDLQSAARQAVEQAVAPLDGPPGLVCVFVCGGGDGLPGADAVERARRRGLDGAAGARQARCGRPAVIGCTASGVIGAGRGVEDAGAVSAWAAVLPGARVTSFRLGTEREPDRVVVTGMPVPAAVDRIAVLLADPYRFPVDAFVAESTAQLGGLPIAGRPGRVRRRPGAAVRLYLDGEVHEGGAVGVLIGGPLEVATVVSQGCRPVGPPMAVTRAAGNEIAELAGRPGAGQAGGIVTGLPEAEQMLVTAGLHIGIAMDEYAERARPWRLPGPRRHWRGPAGWHAHRRRRRRGGPNCPVPGRDAVTAAADLDRLLSIFSTVSGIDRSAVRFSSHVMAGALRSSVQPIMM